MALASGADKSSGNVFEQRPLGVPARPALSSDQIYRGLKSATDAVVKRGGKPCERRPPLVHHLRRAILSARPPRRVYELRRPEAHAIVGHAIRGARALSPDITQREAEEAAWLADAARRARASRWRPLCAVDCVSSCVGDEDVVVEPMPMPLPGSVAPAGWARATSRDAAPGAWRAPPAPSRGPRVDAGGVLAPSRRPTGPQSLFAGDVACDEGATSPATPPEAATPPLPWKGARSSDVFAVEVGSCQI